MTFYPYDLDHEAGTFDALAQGVDFESITQGRVGNHLVDVGACGVPIVRTTSVYTKPAHHFSPSHRAIAQAIQRVASEAGDVQCPEGAFNNALIEIYDHTYFKMGYHSDQALDLEEGSCIALYSCYERPEHDELFRVLKVRNKMTNKEHSIVLRHNSVVLFSLKTNTEHTHKIVLEPRPAPLSKEQDNRWLGITFRTSKTLIQFDQQVPRLSDGAVLELANEQQRKEFYKLRGQENRSLDFTYPKLNYTISKADRMMPLASSATP